MLIYFDMNVYNRVFDDQTQLRIRKETKAIEDIFQMVDNGQLKLCGSFILNAENDANKIDYKKKAVKQILSKLPIYISPNENILNKANELNQCYGLGEKDALHLACAVYAECKYFITCDDNFVKAVSRSQEKIKDIIGSIQVVYPDVFLKNGVNKNDDASR